MENKPRTIEERTNRVLHGQMQMGEDVQIRQIGEQIPPRPLNAEIAARLPLITNPTDRGERERGITTALSRIAEEATTTGQIRQVQAALDEIATSQKPVKRI